MSGSTAWCAPLTLPYSDSLRRSQPAVLFVSAFGHPDRLPRNGAGGYLSKSLPPLEFEYTRRDDRRNRARRRSARAWKTFPMGSMASHYRWVDLDGEGLSGILTEQAGSWFYKANLSPVNQQTMRRRASDAAAVRAG